LIINNKIFKKNIDSVFDRYLNIIFEHFAASVGIALAVIVSLLLVLLLRYSAGPIEFEGMGFKFKGAAAPIILWILCYIVLVSSIKLLW
jgi:hypothetical protein